MAPRQSEPPRPQLQLRLPSTSAKRSPRSHSSSFEADDERSSSPDGDIMGPDRSAVRQLPSQYPGEDTRLTSRKELWGWYAYAFAAEVYVICGIASFIPITLEQLSRENGVLLSDRTTPCVAQPAGAESILSRLISTTGQQDLGQCVIYFLGVEINTASFALYVFSISVLLQALVVVSISCAADHGNFRKQLLLAFAIIGAISTMGFIFVTPKIYLLGALLAIISNTCFGASFVLLNSFLPLLVRHHPSVQVLEAEPSTLEPDESSALLSQAIENPEDVTSIELEISTKISSTGVGVGYIAGLFVQCILVAIVAVHNTIFSLRLVLFIIGAWWLLFTIPSALWLRPRPGPPLPMAPKSSAARTWLGYLSHSWKSLYRTFTYALRLRDISLFLIAWFLLSDAIATVSSTAVLFAKTHLMMQPANLALINVIGTAAGILGAFTWSFVSRYFAMKPVHTILACLALFELIPLYGLLAYLPSVQRLGWLGLQQQWEMYPLGFVYGLVLGGLSSYCRALFGELIPPGSEAAFYALYAITDKGSSVFGPTIVGMIIDQTGQIRAAFWFLAVLVGLPAPIIYFVDVARGVREAKKLAEYIEGFEPSYIDDSIQSDSLLQEEERLLNAAGESEDHDRI